MLINEQIRAKEVLVIGPKGEQLGLKTREDALKMVNIRAKSGIKLHIYECPKSNYYHLTSRNVL